MRGADAFPDDPTQHSDDDGDGFGDYLYGREGDHCPNVTGHSHQAGTRGCPDRDGDGWADSLDAFPDWSFQWSDSDGDGFGDNPTGERTDGCPLFPGTSYRDQFGCPDTDGDGWSDKNDEFRFDASRWTREEQAIIPDRSDSVTEICLMSTMIIGLSMVLFSFFRKKKSLNSKSTHAENVPKAA
jgi:hypothetical protein